MPNTNTTEPTIDTPTTESTSQTNLAELTQTLQDKLLGESDIVSSEDTGFEKAIAGIQGARETTEKRIESQWGREIDYATQQANAYRTHALETRSGAGVQKVALKLLEESNIKYIGDLQRQKEDAHMANDTATALRISDLQVRAMEYEQQAKQQYYSNLLGMANLVQGQATEERMTSQFAENLQLQRDQMEENNRRTAASLAAEYGVTIEEGDTLESVVSKIAPIVSREKKAYLNSLLQTEKEETEEADFSYLINKVLIDETGVLLNPDDAADIVYTDLINNLGYKPSEALMARIQRLTRTQHTIVAQEQQVRALKTQLSEQASLEWESAVSKGEVGFTPSIASTAKSTTPYFGISQKTSQQQYSISPTSTQDEVYGSFYSSLIGE